MAVKRVILIRPGETDWNRLGRWQGWVAAPLNNHGRQQVRRLANFVRNIGMSALYSSDVRRAVQTAEILGEDLEYEPVLDVRLRERNIGSWQGLTEDEVRTWYPEQYGQLRADRMGFCVPGGESLDTVKARILAAWWEILNKEDRRPDHETIGVISHTTALQLLLTELVPGYLMGDLMFSNSSVTSVQRDNTGWKLVTANDVLHLEGMETRSVSSWETNE